MFNGMVETIGKIENIQIQNDCKHFIISSEKYLDDLKIDDSISVNGVCLTVTNIQHHLFHVTAVPETLRLTNLNFLEIGQTVNLERSILLNARINGHYTQGHVDGVGTILDIKNEGDAKLVKIGIPETLKKYIVKKGYVALDGMSITVISVEKNWFTVTFIPHTQKVTIVKHYSVGTLINIEVDILGKYIESLIGAYQPC
ncbi:MAG TPA: riboflavin synthase [Gammaproteobacteria bacterium]|nr:riboflavin synthase [Gammaproteobacteria bacterium]